MAKVFMLLLVAVGNHWIRIHDSNRVHQVYVTYYGSPIGGYYQPKPTEHPQTHAPYTAECWGDVSKPVEFADESRAKAYVERCPQ